LKEHEEEEEEEENVPLTMVHSPFSQVTGKEYMRPG